MAEQTGHPKGALTGEKLNFFIQRELVDQSFDV